MRAKQLAYTIRYWNSATVSTSAMINRTRLTNSGYETRVGEHGV